nr:ATP-binding protein [Bacilli bacterium]
MNENSSNLINIRPASSVYGTYRRLSYTPWFAIAEFIDNSTQSYYNHKEELLATDGFKKLIINIKYDSNEDILEITDNAYGMDFNDFQRAIILDKPPVDRTGRNEFGMGLKTAACWFGDLWKVETSRLGLDKIYSATMDIKEFERTHQEEVLSICKNTNPEMHFTKIVISNLNQKPQRRSVAKIKSTLEKIYRSDLRTGEIDIIWNGEHLEYSEPEIRTVNGEKEIKNVDFEVEGPFGDKYRVYGWIGILQSGSYNNSGFSLLRRGRVIVGSQENYKPDAIFGSSGGDYRRLYLCGELNLNDFPATQAKDNFVWDNGLEDNFIEKLDEISIDYQKKAQAMRQINQAKKVSEISDQKINEIKDEIKFAFEDFSIDAQESKSGNDELLSDLIVAEPVVINDHMHDAAIAERAIDIQTIEIDQYKFRVKWSDENELAPWLTIKEYHDEFGGLTNEIDVIINICHKFFVPYINKTDFLPLINKFALALIVAEKRAKSISTDGDLKIDPESIRNQMNRCLYDIASKEN